MKKIASLSNSILLGIIVLFMAMIYFLAIQPTQKLYSEVKELRSLQQNNISQLSPDKGNVKELEKLDTLLLKLRPSQNLQSIVLDAIGQSAVKLKSFKEEKIQEKAFGGEKGIKKFSLLVSGNYKDLLAISGALKELAISSSSLYVNDELEEFLNLNILVKEDDKK